MACKKLNNYPNLIEELDGNKNKDVKLIYTLSYGSNKKVWWICKKCSYSWKARIISRTKYKTGCPACKGRVVSGRNRLFNVFPDLIKEWHPTKNKNIDPDNISFGSHKKVWWVCKNCGHEWMAKVCNRNRTSCPACVGKVATYSNNLKVHFPEVSAEWHPTLNYELRPEDVICGSEKKVWWQCKKCGYEWKAIIYNKVKEKACPSCNNKILHNNNSFADMYPDFLSEWSNTNIVDPKEITRIYSKKIWWVCGICDYEWNALIYKRINGCGCPACAGRTTTNSNSLKALYPEVSKEWHPTKNAFGPDNVTYGSGKLVWWLCKECGYEWKAVIRHRTSNNSSCPKCAKSSISNSGSKWLDELNISHKNREITIKCGNRRYRVDAYDPVNNIIYEYFGNFWHGNPEIFNPEDTNPVSKKTFGELYNETLSRIKNLESDGYNIVCKWGN